MSWSPGETAASPNRSASTTLRKKIRKAGWSCSTVGQDARRRGRGPGGHRRAPLQRRGGAVAAPHEQGEYAVPARPISQPRPGLRITGDDQVPEQVIPGNGRTAPGPDHGVDKVVEGGHGSRVA